MRGTEERPPGATLDLEPGSRFARAPAAPDDAPFGAVIGALIGIVISVPLWVLIALVVVLFGRG